MSVLPPSMHHLAHLLTRSFVRPLALAGALAVAACAGVGPEPTSHVAAWSASAQDRFEPAVLPGRTPPPPRALDGHTLRQVLRVSSGGEQWRLKLSNRFGRTPVVFDRVRLARSVGVSSIDPATDRPVTVGGQERVVLAAGAEVWSDPVQLTAAPHSWLAVSIEAGTGPAPLATQHTLAVQTAYVAPGAVGSAATLAYPEFLPTAHWVAAVDALAQGAPKVLVAFGDSITDGYASTPDQARRYPDLLDNRLKADGSRTSVVNAGISGNRWLHDVIGPNGSSRFVRDVLEVSGVTHTLILLGINDIGFATYVPAEAVTADQVIAALQTAMAQATARNVRVILGTLTPYQGARYFTEAGEAKRQQVNAWIRANQAAEAIVDFDQALRDPAHPSRLFPAYDSGDHLHPNDDGYAAMANAVDLAAIR